MQSAIPRSTSLKLIPAKEVEFPAILVDAGTSLDPMGIVKKSQNMIAEDTLNSFGVLYQLYFT